jgi:MscS family membrane protein
MKPKYLYFLQVIFLSLILSSFLFAQNLENDKHIEDSLTSDIKLAKTLMIDIRYRIYNAQIDNKNLTFYKEQLNTLENLFLDYKAEFKRRINFQRNVMNDFANSQNTGSIESMREGTELFHVTQSKIKKYEVLVKETNTLLNGINVLLVEIFNSRVKVSDKLLFSNVTSFYHAETWILAFQDIITNVGKIKYDISQVNLKNENVPGAGFWFILLFIYLAGLYWFIKWFRALTRFIRKVEKRVKLSSLYETIDILLKGAIPAVLLWVAVSNFTNPSGNKYDNIILGLIYSVATAINFSLLCFVTTNAFLKARYYKKRWWILALSILIFIMLLNNNINPFLFSTQFYPFIGLYGVAAINLVVVIALAVLGIIYVYFYESFIVSKIKKEGIKRNIIYFLYFVLFAAPVIVFFGYSNLVIGFIVNILQTLFCLVIVYECYKVFTLFLFISLNRLHRFLNRHQKDIEILKNKQLKHSYIVRWLRVACIIVSVIVALILLALFWGVPPLSVNAFLQAILFAPFPISDNSTFSLFSILYALIIFSICYLLTLILTSLVEKQVLKHTLATTGTKYAVKMTMKYVGIIISIVVFIYALGVDTSSMTFVISGLSIGVGFALKDTLSNFFLGILALMTRYVRAGDWVYTVDESIQGTIEHIGLHSTIIRAFNQRPIIVPNSELMSQALVNASRMTNRRILQYISVRYDDIAVLDSVLKNIKEMLMGHKDIDQTQTTLVNLVDGSTDMGSTTEGCYGAYAVNFMIYTFTKTTNWVEFQNVQDEIMLKVAKIIEESGAEIAFPTSTLYFNKKQQPSDKPD